MNIQKIKKSYINVSGNIYNSEFINLANIANDSIAFDDKTLFLNKEEKEKLNSEQIKKYEDVIYIFEDNGKYGIICDIPISEYKDNKIKCHELVLPDTIQGMLSNLHGYNSEAAPILLGHNEYIDYGYFIKNKLYTGHYSYDKLNIYVIEKNDTDKILELFDNVNNLYVADGHHRLSTTLMSGFKESVLACVISFDYLDILPIHRVFSVDQETYKNAMEFIEDRFSIENKYNGLKKGQVELIYNNDRTLVNLVNLDSDAFWNNDIYRLNTQILSQAFRIFNTTNLKYITDLELGDYTLEENELLIKTHPLSRSEFIESVNNNYIMPPKSTCIVPKFPSFLIFKKYQ